MQKPINQNPNVPVDLLFVWDKYNLKTIADTFAVRYSQTFPKTALQQELENLKLPTAEFLSRAETFEKYGIDERLLFLVYTELEKKAIEAGVSVEYSDITGFSEDDFYENHHVEPDHKKHAETARSDGKNLLLEISLEKAGGIQGRLYDLMHLTFGHMVQWSSEDSKLLLTREEAWSIGYRNHETSPDRVVDMMSFYEFEAGMQGIEALRQVLDRMNILEEQKDRILQYFVDYVYCDSSYIIQHYRGNHQSFQKFWKFGQPIPPRGHLPNVEGFIKRHAVEIGLIQDVEKSAELPSAYQL